MTVPSQGINWSFAPQSDKVGDGVYDQSNYDWRNMNVVRINLGTQVDEQQFPLELGGNIVPPDAFRQAHFYAGNIELIPRLEDSIGYLLLASMGAVTTTANTDIDGNSVTGVHTHRFRFNSASPYLLPWLSSRCKMPSATGTVDRGEIGYDCKIANVRITVPQMGKIRMSITMVGRKSEYDNTPASWTYVNDYEFGLSSPDAGRGQFKLGGVEYPALGASIDIMNNLSSLQQEMVVGSFNPDDFVPLTRNAGITWVYKYEDNQLAQKVLTGTDDGTDVILLPSYLETDETNKALDVRFDAPTNIPGTTTPYRMAIQADRATLARSGAPQSRPGDIITENYSVNLIDPGTGSQYVEILLQNGIPSYTWADGNDDDVPVVLLYTTAFDYSSGDLRVVPEAEFYDADTNVWTSGTLVGTLGGAGIDVVNDALSFADYGLVTVSGSDISFNGTIVATWTGDGQAGTLLTATFNSSATPVAVEAVIEAVNYTRTGGGTPADVVTVSLVLTDPDANASTADLVTITHV